MPKMPVKLNKVMKYHSPSGKIFIGKYIPPFKKIKNGYGFFGVVISDYKSGKLQCSVCGNWYERLGPHIFYKHNLTAKQYKDKFGLLYTTALVSMKQRLKQSKFMTEMLKNKKFKPHKFKKNNKYAGNRKNTKINNEYKNKYGVCELQIITKIKKLKKKLGKTPTLIDLKREYGGTMLTTINNTFHSYIALCDKLGMKRNISSRNPKYNKMFFLELGLSNEPNMKYLTVNERAGFYRIYENVNEWKKEVKQILEES